MPSPSPIPRSSSYANISSSDKSQTFVPRSNRSVASARTSSKFSYWPHWSNINQLGNLIIPARKSSDSSSKHSDLTEESLEAHNRRHAPIIHDKLNDINVKNAKCSPYYKGLTDASLVINRERHVSSPGRESQATTVATSTSSSLSSLIMKMQEWSSCFNFKSKENHYHAFNNLPTTCSASATTEKKQAHAASSTASSSTGTAVVTFDKEMHSDKEEVDVLSSLNKEKPLRERVSESESETETETETETESSTTLPPNKSHFVNKDDENKGTNTQEMIKNEGKFTWANKYQPKTLKDFICNRDKAMRLQDLVRYQM